MALEITVVLVLILINAFFALSEMSVVTSRKPKLKQLAGDSRSARAALDLAEHPERFLSTVQVGITLISILTGLFGGAAIGARVGLWLGGLGIDREVAEGLGVAISVALITYFSIIFGELVPKRAALLAPERIAGVVAVPMQVIAKITAPFVWLLTVSTRTLLRVLRLQGSESRVSEEEIRLLVAEGHEQGLIDDDERNMMNRVMRLGDRSADSLMTPRTRIAWLDATASRDENLEVMRDTPFSRYPVYRGSDSEVIGVLESKSLAALIGSGERERDALFRTLRPPLFVSESTRALNLLEIFREENAHLALVVDEYGDIQGLVTLNDLLGAVLGRLQQDESEADEEAQVVRRQDGSYLVDGRLSTEDLRELLSLNALPDEEDHDYNTVAGMMIARFGRIPHSGEAFDWEQWRFEVVDLDGARIDKLLVQRVQAAPADTASDPHESD
ncbi:hemolysin family protein [Chiayiivirga flava]|uniref:Putative hemolysin n=1 Tax=Chiayiivirga flava TaxID=659595 RepID=A0A7W8D2L0_9GAMM|nr:hemolysin family protein [Chiayiivirga flava]MBB5206833.1 putative hemolysin [Chiayiivirga flava]